MKIQVYLISLIFLIIGSQTIEEKLNLKTIVEEAISKSLIGNDPIIVANPFSAKIYSKLDLKHPVWNNLKIDEFIVIPKNSALVEKLWGKQAEEYGVIVYRAAQDNNYEVKKLRFIVNGKEISKTDADKIDKKDVNSFIIIKDRNSEERFAFINTLK